jgi:hypothetical protein
LQKGKKNQWWKMEKKNKWLLASTIKNTSDKFKVSLFLIWPKWSPCVLLWPVKTGLKNRTFCVFAKACPEHRQLYKIHWLDSELTEGQVVQQDL